jgi:hypothetical protein
VGSFFYAPHLKIVLSFENELPEDQRREVLARKSLELYLPGQACFLIPNAMIKRGRKGRPGNLTCCNFTMLQTPVAEVGEAKNSTMYACFLALFLRTA